MEFIKKCARERRVFWTYHVNMRLGLRSIPRQMILDSADSFEIIEEYPGDKYLPSYLIRGVSGSRIFHIVIAVDAENENVRVVTAYYPDPDKWDEGFRKRREP